MKEQSKDPISDFKLAKVPFKLMLKRFARFFCAKKNPKSMVTKHTQLRLDLLSKRELKT